MRFVGRFKDTIRSIELCDIYIDKDGSWASFLGWLRENIQNLEKFRFQILQQGRLAKSQGSLLRVDL